MALPIYTNNDRRFQNLDGVVREALNEHASSLNNISEAVSEFLQLSTLQDVLDHTTDEGDGGNARGLIGNYFLKNTIDIGNLYFKTTENNATYSIFSVLSVLTSTSNNPMFSEGAGVTGNTLFLQNIFISSPNAATFNILSGNSLITSLVGFFACSSVGNYTGSFMTLRATAFVACADGINCVVAQESQIDTLQYNNGADTGGTALTFSGAGLGIIMTGIAAHPEASEALIDVQASYTGVVSITGGTYDNIGTFFKGSRDQGDPLIEVQNVVNVKSSIADVFSNVAANSTETVIGTIDTPVIINAVWTDVDKSRFDFDSSGRWTYTGLEDVCLRMTFIATVDPVGGSSRDISTYIAVNGTIDPSTRGSATLSTGGQIASIGIIDLFTGDFIEPFIENNSGTQNLVCTVCSMVIG